jgi:hypothetical protein
LAVAFHGCQIILKNLVFGKLARTLLACFDNGDGPAFDFKSEH